jgi:hypothetical protein
VCRQNLNLLSTKKWSLSISLPLKTRVSRMFGFRFSLTIIYYITDFSPLASHVYLCTFLCLKKEFVIFKLLKRQKSIKNLPLLFMVGSHSEPMHPPTGWFPILALKLPAIMRWSFFVCFVNHFLNFIIKLCCF